MEMYLATEKQLTKVYKRDLAASFPASELKPLHAMRAMLRDGVYRPWCLFDGGEIVGEAFVWTYVPGFALFDYLCVTPARRNDGLGALLLQRLIEAERGNVVFGEAEIAAYAPDEAMAKRRLGFYRRNGARKAGYDTCIFGVPYHTLFWSEREVTDSEMRAAHEATYRSRFPRLAYERFVKIPWDASMGVSEKSAWAE